MNNNVLTVLVSLNTSIKNKDFVLNIFFEFVKFLSLAAYLRWL